MNALSHQDFVSIEQPVTEWLVLRCSAGRTLALVAALRHLGAWTPTWTRRRRLPRSPVTRPITEACIPTFAFVPANHVDALPIVPRLPYGLMRVEGGLVLIADGELNHLRKIADKPTMPAHQLPRAGRTYRIVGLGFDGLQGKVIRCSSNKCFVSVEGFAQPLQVPPRMLIDALA